jgi:predicted ATP-grasp superfamily ATP-dependent carboligase
MPLVSMRIFLYEYTSATAADLPASLRAEGRAMFEAVGGDLRRIPGVTVASLEPGTDGEAAFRAAARLADYSLVIAPECDGLLEQRCRWVEAEGGRLLGPSAAAVARTGDKLRLARHLRERGVATPACQPWPGATLPPPVVLKPRFGAGSQATFRVDRAADLPACAAAARAEGETGALLVQARAEGTAVSVAFLVGPGGLWPLPPAWQHLSNDGRYRYLGGRLPLPPALAERAVHLGRQAIEAVPGLRGYVGVDLVLGAPDQVIEINPRLTTSYVGLRQLARANLAEAMLAAVQGRPLPALTWQDGPVSFTPAGRVSR